MATYLIDCYRPKADVHRLIFAALPRCQSESFQWRITYHLTAVYSISTVAFYGMNNYAIRLFT